MTPMSIEFDNNINVAQDSAATTTTLMSTKNDIMLLGMCAPKLRDLIRLAGVHKQAAAAWRGFKL